MPRDGILRDPISVMDPVSGYDRRGRSASTKSGRTTLLVIPACAGMTAERGLQFIQPVFVMAGPDPAIPVLGSAAPKGVDPRHKAGDDVERTGFIAPRSNHPRAHPQREKHRASRPSLRGLHRARKPLIYETCGLFRTFTARSPLAARLEAAHVSGSLQHEPAELSPSVLQRRARQLWAATGPSAFELLRHAACSRPGP